MRCNMGMEQLVTNLNEECHHIQQLLNADIAIAILVKKIEHLKKRKLNTINY